MERDVSGVNHFMDEQDCGDFLDSFRELSSFELRIQTAKSKADVADILLGQNLSEQGFTDRFPDLAKAVRDLPDESSTST